MPPRKSPKNRGKSTKENVNTIEVEDMVIERKKVPITIFFDMDNDVNEVKKTMRENELANFDSNTLWVEKYRPKTLDEYLFDSDKLSIVKEWILKFMDIMETRRSRKFKNGTKYNVPDTTEHESSENCDEPTEENVKPFLVLYGPPGTGKSTLANLIYQEYDLNCIEINASDARSKSAIGGLLGNASSFDATTGKYTGIIMDEIDGMTTNDNGGISELINIATKTVSIKANAGSTRTTKIRTPKYIFPIICTCNNLKENKIQDLLKLSVVINVSYPSFENGFKLLAKIRDAERMTGLPDSELTRILKSGSGRDYRQMIWSLHTLYLNQLRHISANAENQFPQSPQSQNTQWNISGSGNDDDLIDYNEMGTDVSIRATKYGDTALDRVYNFARCGTSAESRPSLDDIYISASSDPITFYMLTYNNIPEIMSNIQTVKKVRTRADMLADLRKVGGMYDKLVFADTQKNCNNGVNYDTERWGLPYADYCYAGGIFRAIQEYNQGATGHFQLQHHIYYNMMRQEYVRMFKMFAGNYQIFMTMDPMQIYYVIRAKMEAIRKLNNASIHQSSKSFWSNNIKIDDGYQKIINKIDDIFPEDAY